MCMTLQAIREGVRRCLQELQDHLCAPVCISMYNKDLEAALKSEDDRPEHDMRDHHSLRDACQFLLIAAEIIEEQQETIVRLLFNEARGLSNGKKRAPERTFKRCCYLYMNEKRCTPQVQDSAAAGPHLVSKWTCQEG